MVSYETNSQLLVDLMPFRMVEIIIEYSFYNLRYCCLKLPSEICHDSKSIELLIFLLLSSFCPEYSTLVQVFNKIGLIYTFISITPLIRDLEHINPSSPLKDTFSHVGSKMLLSHLANLQQQNEKNLILSV